MPSLHRHQSQAEILGSSTARRHRAFRDFAELILTCPRPLVGCLTLVFDGAVFQFGVPRAADREYLTNIHRSGARPRPTDDRLTEPAFDLAREDLGLEMEPAKRYPRPAIRDRKPAEWVDPVVRVRAADFFIRMLTQRNLGVGEAFLEGEFEMLRGSVWQFLGFLLVNDIDRNVHLSFREKLQKLGMYASWRLSRSHNEDIAHHYDMGDNIMVPMLGATGCYSCGYAQNEDDDLDRMQANKMNLIFSKLQLAPGARILDTGCGNGGMLVHAATAWGCQGEGFTNSHNMASLARRNAERNGVADRVRIHHADFSILESYPDASFDAIYEVGVWEHLPFSTYAEVMKQCWRILKPSGRMLIHSMASHDRVHQRDGYIQKYIFRDSNQIRLHLLLTEACKHSMYVGDVENIARHYYFTLWHWRENLLRAGEQDPSIDDRDFRIQLYFLECGMAESRFGDGSLFHILLFKDARDYRYTWRVDGRIAEAGRGALQDRPLAMKPSNENDHLYNNPFAEAKRAAPVYKKEPLVRRVAHLAEIVRRIGHI